MRPAPEKKRVVMLDGVSGVLKPGRMTLLLGPPGAGKTTLLRSLAGQTRDNKKIKVNCLGLYVRSLCCIKWTWSECDAHGSLTYYHFTKALIDAVQALADGHLVHQHMTFPLLATVPAHASPHEIANLPMQHPHDMYAWSRLLRLPF